MISQNTVLNPEQNVLIILLMNKIKNRSQDNQLGQVNKEECLERKKDKEMENTHVSEIQQERNLAIQKRIAITAAANKKKQKIKTIIILFVVVILAVFIVKEIRSSTYRGELRNFATDIMDESFTNVFADVVAVEPTYFVYRYNTTKTGSKIGNGDLWEIVCKCKTVEGEIIWATFFYQHYPDGDYSQNEDDYKSFVCSADNPMRIIGNVDTARQVVDGLDNAIGNVFVLNVKETSK